MSLQIISAGLLTTIQDTGRNGHQKEGIIVSGAMDALALRIGNLLVGNPENAAALEITLLGPQIYFAAEHIICLTGADLSPEINNNRVKMWRPIRIPKGSLLQFGKPALGCRTYLSISGSFAINPVLGSYATYLRAGLGGLNGIPLQAGDIIPCPGTNATANNLVRAFNPEDNPNSFISASWTITSQLYPKYELKPIIRVMKGPEYNWFKESSQANFWHYAYRVSPQSDRMGYRLDGTLLFLKEKSELLSGAVTFGTVQVPAQGNPIILMADHQTTGGYPGIAQVITADFSTLAQVAPGQNIFFKEASLSEAQELLFRQEQRIAQLKSAINFKLKN